MTRALETPLTESKDRALPVNKSGSPAERPPRHKAGLLRRVWNRGKFEISRAVYRQRIRMGLVPQRAEISADRYEQIRSACIFLGPYRNLTTLTAAMLSLHPTCQVLNHSGFRIFEEGDLNFLRSYSESRFRRFLQYVIDESQGGKGGDDGGAITLSHAFRSETVRDAYQTRFGTSLIKDQVECVVWKESLGVSNCLKDNQIDIDALLQANSQIRFLLPIRNPMDCAVSNCKTGHAKRFRNTNADDPHDVLRAIVDEIRWFRSWARKYPDRFFSYCQFEMDADCLRSFAEFLGLECDEQWLTDVVRCFQLTPSYDHAPDFVATFERLLVDFAQEDPDYAEKMRRFIAL